MERYNGNYRFEYNGPAGSGHGQIKIQDGVISGKDYTEAEYKGITWLDGDDLIINVTVEFSGLPGTYSVLTGGTGVFRHDLEFPIPADFNGVHQTTVETKFGPLDVTITRL